MSLTSDPNDPEIKRGPPDTVPVEQHEKYLVLSEEERAKGFVRPVRDTYIHVGRRVCGKPKSFNSVLHVCVQLPHEGECHGWQPVKSVEEANEIIRTGLYPKGCGGVTKMGRALAETYARDPKFYGATYCVHCKMHRPVGEYGEFVWDDGSGEYVGT